MGKNKFQPKDERSRKNSILRAFTTAKKRFKFINITPLTNGQLILEKDHQGLEISLVIRLAELVQQLAN